MDNRTNTIAGWVLGAGIVALGASIVTGEIYHAERPHKMGFPIEGVEEPGPNGAAAEQPIAAYMASADPKLGENTFKKCTNCHGIAPGGGGPSIGPNLFGVMGRPVAGTPGFAFSEALKSKGGKWDWETMNQWIKSPKDFAPGTKMGFAGISKPEERANLLAYLNSQGSNLPLPPPPAAAGDPAQTAAEQADMNAVGDKAEKEPVLNEAQVAKQPEGNAGGEGVPKVAGRAGQEKH